MKTLIIYCLFLSNVIGQNRTANASCTIKYQEDIEAAQMFQKDLKAKNIRIYLQGGIVSVIRPADKVFEKKYSVTYHDFGCVAPKNIILYVKYNRLVFEYLKKEFGTGWGKEMNVNAIGWQECKPK